jgi:uncharacterized protein YggE
MRVMMGVLLLAMAAPVLAQVPPAELGARYVPAPWWMREPVIASVGMVRTEIAANRASFSASFNAVAKSADAALAEAAAKVREIDAALRKSGPERVRIATTFQTQPLYEQYRDKEGNMQTNARPDKIERYAVTARITLEVRDLAALEPAYAAVVAAKPESISPVNFNLEPDNAAKTWLQTEAVKDAARRARQAAEAAGSRLGMVKVIDPSGRACQTDVLAGWPGYASNPEQRSDVQYSGRMMADAAAPPPPPAPSIMVSGGRMEMQQVQVSLQPPLLALTDDACVVYGLGPG